jgi:copper chaperone
MSMLKSAYASLTVQTLISGIIMHLVMFVMIGSFYPLDPATVGRRTVRASSTPIGDIAMCGCSTHQSQASHVAQAVPDALSFRVEDMTCGHCAGTITNAIEAGIPGTKVQADPASKLVSVAGSTDLISIRAIVTAAGYTPETV